MAEKTTFQERLAEAIDASTLSQKDIAERLKVDQARVSQWKHGTHMPSADYLLRLPAILNVDGHWLLTGEGTMRHASAAAKATAYELMMEVGETVRRPDGVADLEEVRRELARRRRIAEQVWREEEKGDDGQGEAGP